MKFTKLISVLLVILLICISCGKKTSENLNNQTNEGTTSENLTNSENSTPPNSGSTEIPSESKLNAGDMFSKCDLDTSYDESSAVKITLGGKSASCDSDSVEISDKCVNIIREGTYIVSGSLDDGMIKVVADKNEKVTLVLDGVTVSNGDGAAIYVLSADKVFIKTAENSVNTLTNGGKYTVLDENNIDAVIFSKEDITFCGKGMLKIEAPLGHGIVSKDDLVFTGGTYEINADSHALNGKDSVRIANGIFDLKSGKDALHSENADDTSLGFVYIENGSFVINSDGDALSSSGEMLISGGTYDITIGGGSKNAPAQGDEFFRPGGFGGQQSGNTQTSAVSAKALKSSALLTVKSGNFKINSSDDALHSDGNLLVLGGDFEIECGDDGMHADSALKISGGRIDITKSYEGLEGLSIDVIGGEISLIASDDGLNAAGGNDDSGFGGGRPGDMFAKTDGAYIKISGGKLSINASGDGIDSNGTLTVTGGETLLSGPTSSGNGTLDYNGSASISGGVFMASGSSGMAQNFGQDSTQCAIMTNVTTAGAGSVIELTDSSGNVIVSFTAEKSYSNVIISSPELKVGETYILKSGGYTAEIKLTETVYGSGMGGGMPGGGGFPGGGAGGRPEFGDRPDGGFGGRY